MRLKKFNLLLLLTVFLTPAYSESLSPLKNDHVYSVYSGTFDTIDKENDAKTSFYGIQHSNTNLFKETILGKFSPVTGGFLSGKNGIYLYTGVQAEYDLGLINIIPSFAPGYYEAGSGKNLGSDLEFKSEIKVSFEIFKDSKIGYSYSHISNNEWGDINPGVDNQQISFTKIF